MDHETALVAKALGESGGFEQVISRGIDPEHFADDEVREVYEWSLDFYTIHKQPPSVQAVRKEFPGWKPKLNKDPLSYHIDEFILAVKERTAIDYVRGYHDLLEDPKAIRDIEIHALDMARALAETVPAPRAEYFARDALKRKDDYYRRQKAGGLPTIKLGIPTYDEITLGQQLHELLIFAGPPGGGKTTMMQFRTISAYLQGKSSLFISLEVEGEQILRKFDTMLADISYHALKALELDVGQEEKWHAILERADKQKLEREIIVRDDIKNCTVAKVAAEQLRYKPDLVVVDYLEEMRAPRNIAGWEGVSENARGLKQNARVTRVPCVTGTQINREGETSHQSAQKLCDMLIVMMPPEVDDDDEDDEPLDEMELVMRKYRDGPSRKKVMLHWDLNSMDIREKGVAERFPDRHMPEAQNGKQMALSADAIIRGKDNPWTPKKKKGGIAAAAKKARKK